MTEDVPVPPVEASPYQISRSAVTLLSFSWSARCQVTPPPLTDETVARLSAVLENSRTRAFPAVTGPARVTVRAVPVPVGAEAL